MTKEQQILEDYQQTAEIHRIAVTAVRKTQEESHRMNVPNVYSRDGTLYYDWTELVKMDDDASHRVKLGGEK